MFTSRSRGTANIRAFRQLNILKSLDNIFYILYYKSEQRFYWSCVFCNSGLGKCFENLKVFCHVSASELLTFLVQPMFSSIKYPPNYNIIYIYMNNRDSGLYLALITITDIWNKYSCSNHISVDWDGDNLVKFHLTMSFGAWKSAHSNWLQQWQLSHFWHLRWVAINISFYQNNIELY